MVDSADSSDPHAPIPLMRASQSSPTCLFDCPGHHHHHHHDHNGQNGRGDSLDRTEQHFLFPDVSGDDSETSGTSGYRAAIPPHIPGSARGRSKPLRRQQKTAEKCCLAPIGALPVTRIPENNNHADDTTSECQYCPDCEAKDASNIQSKPCYNKKAPSDGRNSANSGKYVGNSKSHFFYGCPTVPRIKTFDECTPMMSASMHGLSTVHRSQPYEDSCGSVTGTLERRFNRSCDWSHVPLNSAVRQGASTNDAISLRSFNNPIAQVSSDILRVSGYTNQFRNLLTARSRRESGGPETLLQTSPSTDDNYIDYEVNLHSIVV